MAAALYPVVLSFRGQPFFIPFFMFPATVLVCRNDSFCFIATVVCALLLFLWWHRSVRVAAPGASGKVSGGKEKPVAGRWMIPGGHNE